MTSQLQTTQNTNSPVQATPLTRELTSQLTTLSQADDSGLTIDGIVARLRLSDRDRELFTTLTGLERENRLNERGKYELAELRKMIARIGVEVGAYTLRDMLKRNPKQTIQTVAEMIYRAQQLVGANNTMTRDAIGVCVKDMLSLPRFVSLTFDDLRLAFKMARCGDFGTTYERIAQRTVFGWLDKYIELKMARAQQIGDERHANTVKPELTDEQLANQYKAFAARAVGIEQQPADHYQPDLAKRGSEQRAALAEALSQELPLKSNETDGAEQLTKNDI